MAVLSKPIYKTVYKCRDCGSPSYQPVIDRADNGALLPNGQYRCTGCRSIFSSVRAWWTPQRTPDFQASRAFTQRSAPPISGNFSYNSSAASQ